jgi:hypothetical protein
VFGEDASAVWRVTKCDCIADKKAGYSPSFCVETYLGFSIEGRIFG